MTKRTWTRHKTNFITNKNPTNKFNESSVFVANNKLIYFIYVFSSFNHFNQSIHLFNHQIYVIIILGIISYYFGLTFWICLFPLTLPSCSHWMPYQFATVSCSAGSPTLCTKSHRSPSLLAPKSAPLSSLASSRSPSSTTSLCSSLLKSSHWSGSPEAQCASDCNSTLLCFVIRFFSAAWCRAWFIGFAGPIILTEGSFIAIFLLLDWYCWSVVHSCIGLSLNASFLMQ